MNILNSFNLSETPIDGSNLIEASAGTGKTYTITGLFIRFLLEKNIPHEKILVVTFTDAATKELKERIREKLKEVCNAFLKGSSDDPFIKNIIKKYPGKRYFEILNDTLKAFDQVQIYTIHGFCRKVLLENAFESCTLFDAEIVKDQAFLLRQIADDFYRKNFHNTSLLFAGYANKKKINPDSLNRFLSSIIGRSKVSILPDRKEIDYTKIEYEYSGLFQKLADIWVAQNYSIRKILLESPGLNRQQYRIKSVEKLLAQMDSFIKLNRNYPFPFHEFEKFGSEKIEKSTKKNQETPKHPFFDLCQEFLNLNIELITQYDSKITDLKRSMIQEGVEKLSEIKQKKNVLGFDDLLSNVHGALYSNQGDELTENIRKKFSVALIDEFQDTDSVQFEIFNKIFPENSNLFLIGDPKQAIYSFRGADIYSYKEASEKSQSKYTLSYNYRSDQGLVQAVNTIFEKNDNPFFFKWIDFNGVKAANSSVTCDPPFNIWYLESERFAGRSKKISSDVAKDIISNKIALTILEILQDSSEDYCEGDIAILVRTNSEAEFVKKSLSNYNLRSVIFSHESVFDSTEASDFARIIKAIANPDNRSRIRAALSTEIMGYSLKDIATIAEDEIRWENLLADFREYLLIWKKLGFIKMIREFLTRQKVISYVTKLADGERRATNILHLTEVLHRFDSKGKDPEKLVKWFDEKRDPQSERDDDGLLRLSSDEKLIKIVTIHKSKGMEYPIVFCPFLFNQSRVNDSDSHFFFHDKKDNKLVLDLGSEDKEINLAEAEKEVLAENLRLTYVALTRAKERCYIAYGRVGKFHTSSLAYLFHSLDGDNFTEKAKDLKDDAIISDIQKICDDSCGTIALTMLYNDSDGINLSSGLSQNPLTPKLFNSLVDNSFKVSSFSALTTHHKSYQREDFAYLYEEKTRSQDETDIFSFPKGSVPGLFMHEIFENIDYAGATEIDIVEVVKEGLVKYDFDDIWCDTIVKMVFNVLNVPLDLKKSLSLSRIDSKNKINELEFYFPVTNLTHDNINELLIKEGEKERELKFDELRGFIKGYIDLIIHFEGKYYIIDWKSNHIGDSSVDYGYENLREAISENYYHLQYYIYTVALHKYLKNRLHDYDYRKHFGGVFYIFLRGVEGESETGIFKDLPPFDLIEKLEKIFEGGQN